MSDTTTIPTARQVDNDAFTDLFNQLCQHEPGDRARNPALKSILSMLYQSGVLDRWVSGFGSRYQVSYDRRDDLAQVIAEALLKKLRSITRDDTGSLNNLYLQHMHQIAKSAVTAHLGSGEHTGMSGTSGVSRRKSALSMARQSLIADGVEAPTDQQVIDRANERAQARKNQQKQGMVFTAKDFAKVEATSDLSDDVPSHAPDQIEEVELKFEMAQAVRALVAHIEERHPGNSELRIFALSWVRHTYEGIKPTLERIAEDTGLDPDTLPVLSRKFRHEMTRFRETQR